MSHLIGTDTVCILFYTIYNLCCQFYSALWVQNLGIKFISPIPFRLMNSFKVVLGFNVSILD